MSSDEEDFQQFMETREAAARAFVSGDPSLLAEVTTRRSPATFFGPRGGHLQGPDQVWQRYERDSAVFAPGSQSKFEILHMGASGGIGYWVGLQRASARMRDREQPVPMILRVTEIFRREGDDWKLIHRHADMFTDEAV
jgi:ketosteroid isomerase-like protein